MRAFTTHGNPPSLEGPLPALAAQVVSGAAARDFPAMVTIWAAQAAGQPNHTTIDAGAAWMGLYLAAKLLDDIQDGDESILPSTVSEATRTNLAVALIFSAQSCLLECEPGSEARRISMAKAVCSHSLGVVAGQQMGLAAEIARDELLPHAWTQAHEKGGRPFALACRLGAESVDGAPAVIAGLEEYGLLVGEAVQAIDDGLDVLKAAPRELSSPGGSLALAFAFAVADSSDAGVLQMQAEAVRRGEPEAAAAMRDKLVSMGALRYLAAEAMTRVIRARALLAELRPKLGADGYASLYRVTDWLEPMACLRQG